MAPLKESEMKSLVNKTSQNDTNEVKEVKEEEKSVNISISEEKVK